MAFLSHICLPVSVAIGFSFGSFFYYWFLQLPLLDNSNYTMSKYRILSIKETLCCVLQEVISNCQLDRVLSRWLRRTKCYANQNVKDACGATEVKPCFIWNCDVAGLDAIQAYKKLLQNPKPRTNEVENVAQNNKTRFFMKPKRIFTCTCKIRFYSGPMIVRLKYGNNNFI